MTFKRTSVGNVREGARWKSRSGPAWSGASPVARDRYDDAMDELIEVTRAMCRRKRISYDEEADFVAWVVLRLLETDYALFKKFRGRSQLRSYLVTTVRRLLLDYRISKWGKYTPSKFARRLGDDAVALERYTCRDGFTPEEAVGLVKTNHGSTRSEEILAEILRQLPLRQRAARSIVSLDTIEPPSTERGNPERRLIEEEARARRRAAREVLLAAVDRLSPFEKDVLKLHFADGVRLREIAERYGCPERKLYRDFARLKRALRERLLASGVAYDDLTPRGSEESDSFEYDDGFLDEAIA